MENFVISRDGRILRWTCTACQHDNFFVTRFALYPDKVKWRCEECRVVAVVYRPDKWIEKAMSIYLHVHREGQRTKWHALKGSDSGSGNDINVSATFFAERPDLAGGGHIIDENLNFGTAGRTFNPHAEQFVLLSEKR